MRADAARNRQLLLAAARDAFDRHGVSASLDDIARAAAAGLVRDDIDIADVLDLAAAIAWVGERPERDAGQRNRLLRVVIDGLRPANAPI